MRHRKPSDYKPGDRVLICWGVRHLGRDVGCTQATVMAVFCEDSTNPGLYLSDSDNRAVMLSANQVTFLSHEGVA